MKRSHVIRLNPAPEQEVCFRKARGVARHAYNWALDHWKQARASGKRVKMGELKTEYNLNNDKFFGRWELDMHSQVGQGQHDLAPAVFRQNLEYSDLRTSGLVVCLSCC